VSEGPTEPAGPPAPGQPAAGEAAERRDQAAVTPPLASRLIVAVAERLGVAVCLEPEYGYAGQLTLSNGRRRYFRGTHLDLNGLGAAAIATDKAYAAYFLARLGYPVPEGQTFYSDAWCRTIGSRRDANAAYAYARALGWPVIVKPNGKGQGVAVAKAYNRRELERALRAVFTLAQDRVALVQRPAAGDDYRLVVLDGAVLAAYQRLPLAVVGDGVSSVRELLARRQARLRAAGRPAGIVPDEARLRARLRRDGLTLDAVPAGRTRVVLLDNANLSAGGEAVDVLDRLHPGYADLAARIARDLGLRFCGVDLLSEDGLDRPPRRYTVLEVNAAPGLAHYAASGPRQRQTVEAIYERLLRALVGA